MACGRFDCYYETTLNAWDIAGGALIVQEAGGQISDFKNGGDYLFSGQMVATNGLIHEEVREVLSSNILFS